MPVRRTWPSSAASAARLPSGARAAGEQLDPVEQLVQVGRRQEGEQRLARRAAVGRDPRPGVQAELQVVVAAGAPADPVDQDHVGVVADGQVRGVAGGAR